jgi:glucose-6-phosphate 1-dehydrogenase
MSQDNMFGARVEEESTTADLCELERSPGPCTIVIFGASGDLTYRKLVPALYNLFGYGGLPERFCIIGAGRTQMNDGAFRAKMRQGVAGAGLNLKHWGEFEGSLYYEPVSYDDPASYRFLSARLTHLEREHQTLGNRIFYLAIPPSLYATVARELGRAGLSNEEMGEGCPFTLPRARG